MTRKAQNKNGTGAMGPSRPAFDRRSRVRLPDPPCPTCPAGPGRVHGTVRTSFRVFYKCDQCGGVWDVERPRRR
jgi:hypothetical protein